MIDREELDVAANRYAIAGAAITAAGMAESEPLELTSREFSRRRLVNYYRAAFRAGAEWAASQKDHGDA